MTETIGLIIVIFGYFGAYMWTYCSLCSKINVLERKLSIVELKSEAQFDLYKDEIQELQDRIKSLEIERIRVKSENKQ